MFICGVSALFEVTKELGSVKSPPESTAGENILKEAEKALIQYNMKWNLLRCVKIDGSKNICKAVKHLI